jgi:hypothetical protein
MALTNDDVRKIIDAISALPQWQYLESMMAAAEAEGATTGTTDTVGDALPSRHAMPAKAMQHMPQPMRPQQQEQQPEPMAYKKSSLFGSLTGRWPV